MIGVNSFPGNCGVVFTSSCRTAAVLNPQFATCSCHLLKENAAGGGRCGVEQGQCFNSSLGQLSQPKVKETSGQLLRGSFKHVGLYPWRLRMQTSRLLCEENQGSKRMKHGARKPYREMKKSSHNLTGPLSLQALP